MVENNAARRSPREVDPRYDKVLRRANCLPLSRQEELSLCELKDQGCQRAFNTLVESQLRLVVQIAHRYLTYRVELDDLIQFGNMGLIRAVQTYNAQCARLTTYSYRMINNYIRVGISNTSRTIRVPGYRQFKAKPVSHVLKVGGGKEVPLPPATQAFIDHGVPSLTDLNASQIVDQHDDHEAVDKQDLIRYVWAHVEQLSARDRDILMRRMKGQTLASIGKHYGIKKEWVRRLQNRIMRRLRQAMVQRQSDTPPTTSETPPPPR